MTRTHVLTGAASGIGLRLAQRLSERGDRLVLLVRTPERASEVAASLGARHSVHVVDLSAPAEVERAARRLAAELEAVDSLVHCAGAVALAPVEALALADWQRQLDVNLTTPALLTQALLPGLRAARGTVVFVNSTSGLAASPGWSAYAASKFGLRALADALRAEEAEHGVRVTTVYPSRTATPMQAQVHVQEGRAYDPADWMQPETVAGTICHVLDLPADAVIPEVTLRTAPRPPVR
ncbi:SDR family oxidoreductase [Nocardioides houyundeii]|uniref:SDR family oxidoreductase n=1 Tax=Nocardioides houyundeii TaxID=2045452 RepID=UPI000C767F18|nr:SDR family oxidoreductase [Nocardioides houyundeii]